MSMMHQGNLRERRLPGPVAALTLLALSIALLLGSPGSAQAKVPSDFFGISATAPNDSDFKQMGKANIQSYRMIINWRNVQSTRKGGFNWGGIDNIVRRAADAGMTPKPVLFGTPRFITKKDGKIVPPTRGKNLRAWGEFAGAAADRYGRGGRFWKDNPSLKVKPVSDWIVWNEMNAKNFWPPKANPRAYAKLLVKADRSISKADRKAKIVLGGMYGYPNDRKRSMSAVKFLDKLYRVKGARRHFDAINLHPYGAGIGTVKKQVKQARKVTKRRGDKNVGVLIGELGWASKGPSRSPSVVGSKRQAKLITRGNNLLVKKRKAWNITGSYVYIWRDFSTPSACLWCPGAGLLKKNGKSKPALGAYKRVIRSKR